MLDHSKIKFSKTIFTGTLTEMCVEEAINLDTGTLASQLCPRSTITLEAQEAPTQADWDTNFYIVNGDGTKSQAYFTCEVKSAENGGKYPTFFVETRSVRSNTYPEFLIARPHFIVYVDSITGEQFYYDGKAFVGQVFKNFSKARMNRYETAEGLLFNKEDPEWGFLTKHKPEFCIKEFAKKHKDEIKKRINKGRVPSLHKKCSGLPDLN